MMTDESGIVLLRELISNRQWHAVTDRITSNPHEVGSSLRDERGYTVLHQLLAYNRGVNGDDLVPVVRAILAAADAIDYGSAHRLGGSVGNAADVDANEFSFNVNDVALNDVISEDDDESARGAWRLLADQNNRASWSPLHLVCVQGGITHGKVSLLKALLQINNDDRHHRGTFITLTATAVSQRQYQILTLLDRQKRNILHHMLDIFIPAEDTADTIRLAVSMVPSLLYQRDVRGCTPLEYVLSRLVDNTNNSNSQNPRRRKHLPNNYGNDTRGIGKQRNYTVLKLLVECMYTDNTATSISDTNEGEGRRVQQQQIRSRRNVLQMACLLPRAACPYDGSLISYLCSTNASTLEVQDISSRTLSTRRWERSNGTTNNGGIPTINMAGEVEEGGNYALHLFLLNKSYSRATNNSDKSNYNELLHTTEVNILHALIDAHHDAISIRNANGEFPLHIAMKAGRRRAVSILLTEYPVAVLHNASMFNVHHYVHILGCITAPINLIGVGEHNSSCRYDDVECRCVTIIFNLLRARPDIVSVASNKTRSCSGGIVLRSNDTSKNGEKKDGRRNGGLTLREGRRKTKMSWWSNIHFFS